MRSAWHDAGGDYNKLRAVVHNYVSAGKTYDGTGVRKQDDMDTGAYERKGGKGGRGGKVGGHPGGKGGKGDWHGKGSSGSGKGDGGKGGCQKGRKGNGKGYGKQPGGKGDAGKGGKNDKNRAPYFDGKCSFCQKHGRKEVDCWGKQRGDKRVQAIEGVAAPGEAAPVVETVLKEVWAFDKQSWEQDSPRSEDRWILGFTRSGKGVADEMPEEQLVVYDEAARAVDTEWLLLDSGAAEHVCPRWWHDDAALRPVVDQSTLRDVQGQEIEQLGERTVKCDVVGEGTSEYPTKVAINFTVTDVKEPIVSMVKLCQAGAQVNLQRDESWVEFCDRYYNLRFHSGRVYMGVIAVANRKASRGERREVAAQEVEPEAVHMPNAGGASSSASGLQPPPGLEPSSSP